MQDTSQMFFYMQTLFHAKNCAVWECFHAGENIIWVWKCQPSPNSTWTLNFVEIVWLCDSACDSHVTCVMHNSWNFLMCMHTLWQATWKGKLYLVCENGVFGSRKKFLRSQNCISIWHPPNRDHIRNIIWVKKFPNALLCDRRLGDKVSSFWAAKGWESGRVAWNLQKLGHRVGVVNNREIACSSKQNAALQRMAEWLWQCALVWLIITTPHEMHQILKSLKADWWTFPGRTCQLPPIRRSSSRTWVISDERS